MKIGPLDDLLRAGFTVPLSLYPRRIATPRGYYNPLYYGAIVALQHTHGHTPPVEAMIASTVENAGVPTYFLHHLFAQAVNATKPQRMNPLSDLHLPLSTMLIVLPTETLQPYFNGWEVPFVAYATISNGEQEAFMFQFSLLPKDKIPLSYYGHLPMHGDPTKLHGCKFTDFTPAGTAYVEALTGAPPHDPTVPLPTATDDQELPWKMLSLLYRLFCVLQTREDRFLTTGECTRPERVRHNGQVRKSELWSANFIGAGYKPRQQAPLGGHHASPIMHWRIGYSRTQHYGAGNKQTKNVWIEPTLVNPLVHENEQNE